MLVDIKKITVKNPYYNIMLLGSLVITNGQLIAVVGGGGIIISMGVPGIAQIGIKKSIPRVKMK